MASRAHGDDLAIRRGVIANLWNSGYRAHVIAERLDIGVERVFRHLAVLRAEGRICARRPQWTGQRQNMRLADFERLRASFRS